MGVFCHLPYCQWHRELPLGSSTESRLLALILPMFLCIDLGCSRSHLCPTPEFTGKKLGISPPNFFTLDTDTKASCKSNSLCRNSPRSQAFQGSETHFPSREGRTCPGMSNGFTTSLDNLARMLQIPSALPPFQTASLASDRVGDSSVKWRVGTWIMDFANNSHPNVT